MHFLNKLPGYSKSPSGVEWKIFKKLPIVFLVGTALPCAEMLYLFLTNSSIRAEQQKIIYQCLGFIFSYWFFVGVVFFGCIVVMLMKGPAYVADPYRLPPENKKLEQFPNL
jgi:formate-dependent nitrite reductase membrane component NrfD